MTREERTAWPAALKTGDVLRPDVRGAVEQHMRTDGFAHAARGSTYADRHIEPLKELTQ